MNTNILITAFGILGNMISFMIFLAPLPTFYKIYKKKSSDGFQSIPYLVSLFSAMLWIYYACLKSDSILLLTINSIGIAAQMIYVCLFLYYATKKSRAYTTMLLLLDISGMSVIILLTYFLQKGEARATTVGWMCLVFSLCVFVAPLTIIRRVVRTKSVEYMPFYLSVFLTISAIAWFFYGFLRKDYNIALPNVIGFVLGLMQMTLYMVYKNSKNETDAAKHGSEEALNYASNDPMVDILQLSPFGRTMPSPADTSASPFARIIPSPTDTFTSPGTARASSAAEIEITEITLEGNGH